MYCVVCELFEYVGGDMLLLFVLDDFYWVDFVFVELFGGLLCCLSVLVVLIVMVVCLR